jgi:hypothetical protein
MYNRRPTQAEIKTLRRLHALKAERDLFNELVVGAQNEIMREKYRKGVRQLERKISKTEQKLLTLRNARRTV